MSQQTHVSSNTIWRAIDNNFAGLTAERSNVTIGVDVLAKKDEPASTTLEGVFIGSKLAPGLLDSNQNIFIGHDILRVAATTFGDENIVIGSDSMLQGAVTTNKNVIVGHACMALGTNAGALDNIAIGSDVLQNATSATQNICLGKGSGKLITSGSENTCIGHDAGKSLTVAQDCILIGDQAGFALTSGNDNIFVGRDISGTAAEEKSIHIGKILVHEQQFVAGPVRIFEQPDPTVTADADRLLTAVELVVSGLQINSNVLTANRNIQVPTAAAIVAQIKSPAVGMGFHFSCMNQDSSFKTFLTSNTGVTMDAVNIQNVLESHTYVFILKNVGSGTEAVTAFKIA